MSSAVELTYADIAREFGNLQLTYENIISALESVNPDFAASQPDILKTLKLTLEATHKKAADTRDLYEEAKVYNHVALVEKVARDDLRKKIEVDKSALVTDKSNFETLKADTWKLLGEAQERLRKETEALCSQKKAAKEEIQQDKIAALNIIETEKLAALKETHKSTSADIARIAKKMSAALAVIQKEKDEFAEGKLAALKEIRGELEREKLAALEAIQAENSKLAEEKRLALGNFAQANHALEQQNAQLTLDKQKFESESPS